MRKIGIVAVGTMLFLALSCNKDKTQLKPIGTGTPVNNNEVPTTGSFERIIPFRNDEQVNPLADPRRMKMGPIEIQHWQNTSRFGSPNTPVLMEVRNDEVINPYSGTAKTATTIVLPKHYRNDPFDPNQDPLRKGVGTTQPYLPPNVLGTSNNDPGR